MDWTKGNYTCEFFVRKIRQDTWTEQGNIGGVVSASISRDSADSVPLIEKASMDVTLLDGEEFEDGWYRISMLVEQDGLREVCDVGTFLFERGNEDFSGQLTTVSVSGASVLQPANERKILSGTYAPKGANGAAIAASLLQECIFAPVTYSGSFTLDKNYVFDFGATYLSCVWTLLDAGKWCIQIDGDGTVHIIEKPKEPVLTFGGEMSNGMENLRMLMEDFSREFDWLGIPNRFYVKDGDETAVVTNEDPTSPCSFQAKGRWIDMTEESPTRINGETLTAYAKRRLVEESTVVKKYDYNHEYHPDVKPFSLLRFNLPEIKMDGDFRVISQSLSLANGITVSEKLGFEMKGYSG